MDITTSEFDMISGKEGTNHKMTVEFPMNGRMDITVLGLSDSEDITIVARWDVSEFPVDPIEPGDDTNRRALTHAQRKRQTCSRK